MLDFLPSAYCFLPVLGAVLEPKAVGLFIGVLLPPSVRPLLLPICARCKLIFICTPWPPATGILPSPHTDRSTDCKPCASSAPPDRGILSILLACLLAACESWPSESRRGDGTIRSETEGKDVGHCELWLRTLLHWKLLLLCACTSACTATECTQLILIARWVRFVSTTVLK